MIELQTASCQGDRLVVRETMTERHLSLTTGCKVTRLLVIEDDPMFCAGLAARLHRTNVDAIWAMDGVEGLNAAMNEDVDAVLLDLGLPRMNGYRVLDDLRARAPELPIIIMTGNDDPGLPARLRAWHSVAFLRKPFRLDALLEILEECTL